MALQHDGFIDLPPHVRPSGGFDHAAVHAASGRLYVAHTANDSVDVIDLNARKHVASIAGLPAVAGALVDDTRDLVFTSNRGDDSVGTVSIASATVDTIAVGRRPNGLACDPGRGRLLVAHVGDPGERGSYTAAVIDVASRRRIADLPVAGRTRWTVFDPRADVFHVNVMDPPQIVVVSAGDPVGIRRVVPIPHAGPHGLDIDVAARRLYCACDDGTLVEIDADTGAIVAERPLSGTPDVVFFNPALRHLYVAIGDPGVVDVFTTAPLARLETLATESGAHTIGFDPIRNLVCAFLPQTHRASVFVDA
jgi:DNA-binding beta-propeller fold protein YncE